MSDWTDYAESEEDGKTIMKLIEEKKLLEQKIENLQEKIEILERHIKYFINLISLS